MTTNNRIHKWYASAGDHFGSHYQCRHCGEGYQPNAHSMPPVTGCTGRDAQVAVGIEATEILLEVSRMSPLWDSERDIKKLADRADKFIARGCT